MHSTAAVIAVDQEMLFEIILAANYLDIKPLLSVIFPPARSRLLRFEWLSDITLLISQ